MELATRFFQDQLQTAAGAKARAYLRDRGLTGRTIESFSRLPSAVYIGFNVSPNIIVNGNLERAFADVPLERIVLEINEHPTIRQYDEMGKVLRPMRDKGLRISVDEAGGGVESFRHILQLKPDIIIAIVYQNEMFGQGYELRMLTLNVYRVSDQILLWKGTASGSISTDATSKDLRKAVETTLATFPPK